VSEADACHLLTFSDELYLLRSEYSDYRHLKLLRHCVRMAEHVGPLHEVLTDKQAAKRVVRWINKHYDNEETNRDYRIALRVFAKRVTEEEGIPESVSWVPSTTSNTYDPVPAEHEILDWHEDVLPMLDQCRNPRDAAAIAVAFDSGVRGGKLYDLTLGDVFDGRYSMGIHVHGKEGARDVHLILSVPYLQKWLDAHPANTSAGLDQSAYLWTKLREPDRLSYVRFLDQFKQPAERAGVAKTVTPTAFRKANMRWLVLKGMPQPRIEDRQGRNRGSTQTARYMARFGAESNERAYAELMGVEVEEVEEEDDAPIECPRCGQETPRHKDLCVWCSQALTPEAASAATDLERALFDSAGEASGELLDDLKELRDIIDDHPEVKRLLLENQT
jgi:integrase